MSLTTLVEAQSELEALATDLDRELKTLDGVVKGLAEKWKGETKGAFETTYTEWRKASTELHRALRALHKAAGTAHGNYSSAKTANRTMWGGR
ncbi:WXG100 family type VII secretion target [Streptomyces montanisoli]|uniref:WXG100 family type VII secretion target n=1 Tax=Streptomyces montanisoli TaxID=2798581 RepID=A0A940M8Q8_9ACTN|nr:WXG100 family type VII secretion target [Streptomyces montanisoli]MBP0456362.1 WXG100 family type VII secretion target [Streptomyces montanisoli]